jgi:prepilin peptidase CpaA
MAMLLSIAAITLFGTAAVTDVRRRRISNPISIGLALLGLLRMLLALVEGSGALTSALDVGAAAAVFALGACAFHFGLLGGGDAKLLAAGALWFGAAALGPYLMITVLAGGVLAVLFIAWRLATPGGMDPKTRPSLPYAVAIAAGGILTTAGALWS